MEKIGTPASNRDRIYIETLLIGAVDTNSGPVGYVGTPFCWAAAHVSSLGIGGHIEQVDLA